MEPVTLEGQCVRLEPLAESHHADLCAAGLDPELWRWIPFRVLTPEDMGGYIRAALRDQEPACRFHSPPSIAKAGARSAARAT